MFSLDGRIRYWLYSRPADMRKGFNGLSGIVTNSMDAAPRNGDVYIFANASRNMVKLLRKEEAGLVIYSLRLDMGRMRLPAPGDEDALSSEVAYDSLVRMIRSAIDSPYVRRMRMLAKGL